MGSYRVCELHPDANAFLWADQSALTCKRTAVSYRMCEPHAGASYFRRFQGVDFLANLADSGMDFAVERYPGCIVDANPVSPGELGSDTRVVAVVARADFSHFLSVEAAKTHGLDTPLQRAVSQLWTIDTFCHDPNLKGLEGQALVIQVELT